MSPKVLAEIPEFVDVLITTAELGKRWRMSQANLRMMRATGSGPPFLTLNARAVRYRASDILAFEMAAMKVKHGG